MVKVIGIKFKTSCRIYYFDPLDLPFHAGDGAIVETSRGIEFGEVTCDPKEVEESEIVAPLKPVLRIATEEDKQMREMYRAKEPEAMAICEDCRVISGPMPINFSTPRFTARSETLR